MQDHSLPVEMFVALYEDSVDVDGLADPCLHYVKNHIKHVHSGTSQTRLP